MLLQYVQTFLWLLEHMECSYIVIRCPCKRILSSVSILGLSLCTDFFFFLWIFILMLLCMPGNFGMDTKHCELCFYFVGYWMFLYSYINSPAMFWEAVKL